MEAKTASKSRSRSAEPVGRGTNEKGTGNDKERSSKTDDVHVQIPTDTSPYVQYADLEDYKNKGYGATGHLPVVDRPHHGGGTDGPTLSGSGLPEQQQPQPQ